MLMRALLLLAITTCFGPRPAVGSSDCIDYRDFQHVVGLTWLYNGNDIYGLAASGDFVYAACERSALVVFSVADPAHPNFVSDAFPVSPGYVRRSIVVSNGLAYTVRTDGLRIFDIGDPLNPVLLAQLTLPQPRANALAVVGSLVCIANGAAGLQLVDVSVPSAPVIVGVLPVPSGAEAVAVDGGLACVLDTSAGLLVVDIATPTAPQLIGTLAIPGTMLSVAMGNGRACVGVAGTGLHVVDLAQPAAPTLIGSVDTGTGPRDIVSRGDQAFVTDSNHLLTVDVSGPGAPNVVASAYISYPPELALAVDGTTAYVASVGSLLSVVDITNVNNPPVLGQPALPANPERVALTDSHAWVTDGSDSLWSVDITNPVAPTTTGSVSLPAEASGLAVEGLHAFVAASTAGLQVVDIGDPANPVVVGSLAMPFAVRGVAVSGRWAYLTDVGMSLRVVDIADPHEPQLLGSIGLPGYESPSNLAVQGDFVYVANGVHGVHIINVADRAQPVIAGWFDVAYAALDVVVTGNYAYVAVERYGLQVTDISDPANPQPMSWMYGNEYPLGLAVVGTRAYLATMDGGIQLIDVTDPRDLHFAGQMEVPGYADDIAVQGNIACVTSSTGLYVVPAQCAVVAGLATPMSTMPIQAFPNPTTGATSFRFATSRPGSVQAVVYDVRGRLVRNLTTPDAATGTQEIRWDGHDDTGRAVPAGIYFARVRTPDGESAARFVILR
jgi:hypothetical protein